MANTVTGSVAEIKEPKISASSGVKPWPPDVAATPDDLDFESSNWGPVASSLD